MNPDHSQWNVELLGVSMMTNNNVGEYAGTATITNPTVPGTQLSVAVYYPEAHPDTRNTGTYPPVPSGSQYSGFLQALVTTTTSSSSFSGYVSGLNDKGVLLLNSGSSPTGQWAPYLQGPVPVTNSGGSIALGSLGGNAGVANALNNDNQIVGWSQIASGALHAFLYTNGTMQDLNLVIPPTSGITLIDAVGIDGSGRIVAYGTDASGQMDEFLLTPQIVPAPEPSTMVVFGFAILAMAAHRARSRRSPKS